MAEEDVTDGGRVAAFASIGAALKAARLGQNLDIADIAKKTRITQRHLVSLEEGNFSTLPGKTYVVGFVKSYARALDLDEVDFGNQVRTAYDGIGDEGFAAPITATNDISDPARMFPKTLAWSSAAMVALVVVGYLVWRSLVLNPATMSDEIAEAVAAEEANGATVSDRKTEAGPANVGPVVLTATDEVWLKIYDANEERIYENQMKAGDSFTVPADANKPMIVTGRPNALSVSIGGKPVAPLGTTELTIKDVEISAAALLARGTADTSGTQQP